MSKLQTVIDKLLETQRQFSVDEMVLAAWKAYPESFGMRGFPEYPDSHRVLGGFFGRGSPSSKLRKIKPNTYTYGWQPVSDADLISVLMQTEAVKLVNGGKKDQLKITQLIIFLGHVVKAPEEDLEAAISEMRRRLIEHHNLWDDNPKLRLLTNVFDLLQTVLSKKIAVLTKLREADDGPKEDEETVSDS